MNVQDVSPPVELYEIARRHCSKPGFKLIDCLQVALPVFVIPIEAIVIASKPLGLVNEFVLRSIAEGINTLPELSGFLGLDEVFMKKRLCELITSDLVSYGATQEGQPLAQLTIKGIEAVKNTALVQPVRESFWLAIDGITRNPLAVRRDRLLSGMNVRSYGLKEIRAFPADRAPEFHELAAMDLTEALARGARKEKNVQKVMALASIGRRLRRYQEAVMLVFQSERGREIHVEFFIDGRPHQQITQAFARHDGVKTLHILEQVEESSTLTRTEIESLLPNFVESREVATADSSRASLQPFVAKVGFLESKIQQKETALDGGTSHAEVQKLKQQIDQLQAEKAKAESDLNSIDVRHLEVHEHRPLFNQSLETAKRRLLIVSPWITDKVLTYPRLQKIQTLANHGVEIFIGYGIGDERRRGSDTGQQAVQFLANLAAKNKMVHFKEFGDTHAKILLVDDVFAVIGSFNWLSFEGDCRLKFREELSYYVNVKTRIEELFQRFRQRF